MAEKKRLIKTSTIVYMCIIAVLVIAAVIFIEYFKDRQKGTGETDEVLFPNMYSSSRYFFRIGYDEGWSYTEGSYGFYLDEDRYEVVNLYPTEKIEKTSENGTVSPETVRQTDCTVKIFAKPIENHSGSITSQTLMTELLGQILGTEGYFFTGSITGYENENVSMSKTEYSYTVDNQTHQCAIYTVARSMEEYVIVTDITEAGQTAYRETVSKMISDFRFSVFDD